MSGISDSRSPSPPYSPTSSIPLGNNGANLAGSENSSRTASQGTQQSHRQRVQGLYNRLGLPSNASLCSFVNSGPKSSCAVNMDGQQIDYVNSSDPQPPASNPEVLYYQPNNSEVQSSSGVFAFNAIGQNNQGSLNLFTNSARSNAPAPAPTLNIPSNQRQSGSNAAQAGNSRPTTTRSGLSNGAAVFSNNSSDFDADFSAFKAKLSTLNANPRPKGRQVFKLIIGNGIDVTGRNINTSIMHANGESSYTANGQAVTVPTGEQRTINYLDGVGTDTQSREDYSSTTSNNN